MADGRLERVRRDAHLGGPVGPDALLEHEARGAAEGACGVGLPPNEVSEPPEDGSLRARRRPQRPVGPEHVRVRACPRRRARLDQLSREGGLALRRLGVVLLSDMQEAHDDVGLGPGAHDGREQALRVGVVFDQVDAKRRVFGKIAPVQAVGAVEDRQTDAVRVAQRGAGAPPLPKSAPHPDHLDCGMVLLPVREGVLEAALPLVVRMVGGGQHGSEARLRKRVGHRRGCGEDRVGAAQGGVFHERRLLDDKGEVGGRDPLAYRREKRREVVGPRRGVVRPLVDVRVGDVVAERQQLGPRQHASGLGVPVDERKAPPLPFPQGDAAVGAHDDERPAVHERDGRPLNR